MMSSLRYSIGLQLFKADSNNENLTKLEHIHTHTLTYIRICCRIIRTPNPNCFSSQGDKNKTEQNKTKNTFDESKFKLTTERFNFATSHSYNRISLHIIPIIVCGSESNQIIDCALSQYYKRKQLVSKFSTIKLILKKSLHPLKKKNLNYTFYTVYIMTNCLYLSIGHT